MKRDKYNFLIIHNIDELKEAKENQEPYVSVHCNCCNRQLITEIITAQIILINNKKIFLNHGINTI